MDELSENLQKLNMIRSKFEENDYGKNIYQPGSKMTKKQAPSKLNLSTYRTLITEQYFAISFSSGATKTEKSESLHKIALFWTCK